MITAVEKVAAIRDAGYKVAIRHLRHVHPNGYPEGRGVRMMSAFEVEPGWTIRGRGGKTTVAVFVQDDVSGKGVEIAVGLAWCSEEDLFERRKGFELATQRAIAAAPELRAVIGALASEKAAAS